MSEEEGLFGKVLRLEGARFAGGRLPVDALVELERYEHLVVEVAAKLWHEAHPGRKRLPNGFDASFHLVLTGIEEGSAVPVLDRLEASAEHDEWFVKAAIQIAEGFEAMLAGDSSSPQAQIVYSAKSARALGDSLLPDEAIGIRTATDRVVHLTKAARDQAFERAALLQQPAADAEVPGLMAGRLSALDADKRTFRIKQLGAKNVVGQYENSELTADMRKVLDSSAVAPVVRVEGLLQVGPAGQVLQVLNAISVELLEVDGQPWSGRIIELASLPDGWGDGGRRVQFAALDAARDVFLAFQQAGRPEPGVAPMEDGGVVLEWGSPERVVNVEISPDLGYSLFPIEVADHYVETSETVSFAEALEFLLREAP